MSKAIKIWIALLALVLIGQLALGAAPVYADGAAADSATVAWSVTTQDGEGHELTLSTAEAVESALGSGFALGWGKDGTGADVVVPTVADLRRNGVTITPPQGSVVSAALLVADGEEPAAGSKSLLSLAQSALDGSGRLTLPAAIFAEDFNAASVGAVFNGSGSAYTLHISLERAPAAEITLRYTAGALADALGETALVPGGNSLTLPLEGGCASVDVAALEDAVAEHIQSTYSKQPDGWKLILPSGAGASVQSGERITLSSSATLEAQWKDVVVKRPITFRVSDVSGEYTGEALMPSAYTIASGSLAEGHSVTASYSGRQTLLGSSTGSAAFTILDAEGRDVSDDYAISVINGTITVSERSEKQALTVTVRDTEKEYDGAALSSAEYALTEGALLGSDRLVPLSFTGSITGVGSGSVSAAFAVMNGETDVSGSYAITVVPGKLTVKPRALVLTADSAEKEFDGTALTKESFTLSSGTLVEGHTVTASVKGTQTEVGSSANKIDAASVKVTDGAGNDVTALYSARLVDGTLSVKAPADAAALTVTMKSAEKVYDGTALTSKDYEITSGALAEGDTLVLGEVTGEQTAAGETTVTAVFTVRHGESDVTAKYKLTVENGKLTVKPRPITITASSASKIYDGRALTRNSYSISSGELAKGHKLTASVTGSQTELGSSANSVVKNTIKITDASGNDVTANYSITTAAGTLTVNRDPVTAITLSVGDSSKVYDGKPYRFLASDIKVIAGGPLPSGYRIEATFNPEAPVDAGKYDVTIKSVSIKNASGADVTNQFNITRAKGTLTITERPLVIETKAANKIYDGAALTERSTPNISGRAENDQVTLRITGSQTKVGSSENTVADVKITNKDTGADVTKNYAISYQYGLLTVTSAEAAETEESYTWVGGSAGTLFIKLEHDYDGFEGLLVDGKELDRSAYTSAAGSTEIWLKASYLNTLPAGSHTLSAKYAGGESIETTFAVNGTQSTRTSGGSHLGLWIAIMAAALVAVFAAGWFLLSGRDLRWKRKH